MPNLLFCMTPGIGLDVWKRAGYVTRELRPYVEYVRRGWKIRVLTFGQSTVSDLPEGVGIITYPDYRLLWLLPWVYRGLGEWADLIKTNQSVHAFFYTGAAQHWGKPILLRCGYVQGEYLESVYGMTPRVKIYQRLEARAFRQATKCQVPTIALADWVRQRYAVQEHKINVVPNFVDTNLFRPLRTKQRKPHSIISVGRLVPVKRFDLLVRACAEIKNCSLTIVGEGTERKKLESLAKKLGVSLHLPGNLSNEELPEILSEHEIFAITAEREGHPKAVLEGMACGLPCVGTNERGIRDVIQNNQTGLLVESSVSDVASGIRSLLTDHLLRDKFGSNGVEVIGNMYSFENCFERELRIVSDLLSGSK